MTQDSFPWLRLYQAPGTTTLSRDLALRNSGCIAIEFGDQLLPPRILLGIKRNRVHQRHHVPAHGPGPELRRISGSLIGPALLLRLIPSVIEQARVRIARVLVQQCKLLCNIAESLGAMKHRGILGIKRFRHVETVEPHLIRISLLVPESPGRRARLMH